MDFSSRIIEWYNKFKRDLPWRNSNDPYKIWLSEIILQQTQVQQGLPYYHKFIEHFPSIELLARADEEQVLKLWQGLGYYSRARNLHFTAKKIVSLGSFPNTYNDIKKLKGVGDYTAAAIASFAFKLPHAVVDGNVYRLLSRFYGIELAINSTEGKNHFYDLAQSLLNTNIPNIHNQAIMEFGSQQCKPKKPLCCSCPLKSQCLAFNQKSIERLPVKIKKTRVKKRYFDYFYFKHQKSTWVGKSSHKELWKNLNEFPLIVNHNEVQQMDILKHPDFKQWTKNTKAEIKSIHNFKHKLSHIDIFARFWEIELDGKLNHQHFKAVSQLKIKDLAVSRLTEKYLQKIKL